MDIADRGGRPEQRDDALAHQGPQHEHVVALVAVPGPAGRQVRQAEGRRKEEERGQRQPVHGRDAPIDHAGAIRPRALPASWNAALGNGRSGLPAHNARARCMFTLS